MHDASSRHPRGLAVRGLGPGSRTPQDALQYEIAQEMASTLGRLGRQLEAALAALREFDQQASSANAMEDARRSRAVLVGEAGMALWHFVVQRESLGLRDSARVMRDYGVPGEVRDRMGVLPPKQA